MRTSRLLVLALLLLILAAAAGCSPIVDTRTAAPAEATPAEATATPAAEIAKPAGVRVLRVGVDVGFPPFTYIDDSGHLVGFEIDLMNTLTSLGDFEVAYLPTSFEQLLPGLQAGDFDVALGALTVTDARRELVDFTSAYFGQGLSNVSYFSAGQGLAVAAGSPLRSVDELTSEQRIGVKRFTTGERWAEANVAAELLPFATAAAALKALEAGELDGVVLDVAVIAGFLRSGELQGVRLAAGPFTDEAYAMAVAKPAGAEPATAEPATAEPAAGSDTLTLLNDALQAVEGPLFDQLVERWFGHP